MALSVTLKGLEKNRSLHKDRVSTVFEQSSRSPPMGPCARRLLQLALMQTQYATIRVGGEFDKLRRSLDKYFLENPLG